MFFADILKDYSALIGLAVLAAMFVGFVREKTPPAAIAATGAAFMIAVGYVAPDDALSVFSNGAAITVAAMLIISVAFARTGILEAMISRIVNLARTRPRLAIVALLGLTMVASAFVNSTPVVVMLIPVMTSLAAATGVGRRRLLIPLSYFAIFGGTCTLIGTSTNLLVDSVARQQGMQALGIFSITPIGLMLAAVGAAFLFLTQSFLLPVRSEGDEPAEGDAKPDIITELRIGKDFSEIGKAYSKAKTYAPRGIELVSAWRAGEKLDTSDPEVLVMERDRVVLRVTQEELATLRDVYGVELGLQVRSSSATPEEKVTRIVLAAGHRAVDQRIAEADFLSRVQVRILGASRRTNPAGPDLANLRLKAGDSLWVAGPPDALQALRQDVRLIQSETPLAKPFRRDRAILVLITLAAVIALATLGIMPIAALALVAVGFLFAVHAIDPSDAWRALDGDVLALIFSMLIVGIGLQNSGTVEAIINVVLPVLQNAPPVVVVLAVYVLTSILTEMVTNNAVAVILTPIAISLAASLDMPPQAMVLAVLFGASASFATPIGYQTNTLVASAGGYRFADFLRVGVPMNIVAAIVTTVGIWVFYL
ncbi:SLC13 family permease [Ciceribacter sp. L1K22]|uniref:SLC13 family permease n=1 Tax=Ciceribacter sp. L1K22 TaxID=2820275 RepID=UPI001ABDB3EC|nr:SLC13 family permease [Ciceribacter sp. L1K22]MBO3759334.1 SLC13 family permease [Ciceribacter sp. L1K22]